MVGGWTAFATARSEATTSSMRSKDEVFMSISRVMDSVHWVARGLFLRYPQRSPIHGFSAGVIVVALQAAGTTSVSSQSHENCQAAHVSIQTTERYLGCKQRFRNAVNDRIGLEPNPLDTQERPVCLPPPANLSVEGTVDWS